MCLFFLPCNFYSLFSTNFCPEVDFFFFLLTVEIPPPPPPLPSPPFPFSLPPPLPPLFLLFLPEVPCQAVAGTGLFLLLNVGIYCSNICAWSCFHSNPFGLGGKFSHCYQFQDIFLLLISFSLTPWLFGLILMSTHLLLGSSCWCLP